jgi:hypothetical protein
MTLIIQKPTGAKLNLAQTYVGIDDPDAAAYITAVEAADTAAGQSGGLETATKVAIHSFVKGCKNDGIWPAIKASCILAGARTLDGALVPLVGAAPTNNNFVSGDYNRKTGLAGDGSTKYVNSNRNQLQDPQANKHLSVYISQLPTTPSTASIMGTRETTGGHSAIQITVTTGLVSYGLADQSSSSGVNVTGPGFMGFTRKNLTNTEHRINGSTGTRTRDSTAHGSNPIRVFGITHANLISNPTISFYSIGESLDLALLDARVTDLINAFAAAIP